MPESTTAPTAAEPAEPPAEAPRIDRRSVLAAGALGTTYLLLRNRAAFGGLSPALGTRFNGNGDHLAFVRRAGAPT